jgi:hypothetical protein
VDSPEQSDRRTACDRLLVDPKRGLLPRPPLLPGVVHLELVELVDEQPQGGDDPTDGRL